MLRGRPSGQVCDGESGSAVEQICLEDYGRLRADMRPQDHSAGKCICHCRSRSSGSANIPGAHRGHVPILCPPPQELQEQLMDARLPKQYASDNTLRI